MENREPATSVLDSALKLAKPVVETACRLYESLLGEPCKVAGGMLADQIYAWRWRNRIRILNNAKQILQATNVAARAIPPGFLLPLLEAAGDVEEPSLQEMWARLVASGVGDDSAQHPAFIKTLAQLSPLEARILHAIPARPVFGLIQLLSNRVFLTGFILAGKPFRLPFGDPPTLTPHPLLTPFPSQIMIQPKKGVPIQRLKSPPPAFRRSPVSALADAPRGAPRPVPWRLADVPGVPRPLFLEDALMNSGTR